MSEEIIISNISENTVKNVSEIVSETSNSNIEPLKIDTENLNSNAELTKEEILMNFIEKNNNAPAQRSEEWYKLKCSTIGGSEVSTVIGYNPFKKLQDLVGEKAGLPEYEFKGSNATRWGTLFEAVTVKYTEDKYGIKIYETGSIEGKIDRQRYSPDGLGIIDNKIYLFEFKAPFSTVPIGKIPHHYIPQVQTGLLTIDIADSSRFINNMYRKCSLEDLRFDISYDTKFHISKIPKCRTPTMPICCGIIGFKVGENNSRIDYGKLNIDELLILVEGKHIGVVYFDIAYNDLEISKVILETKKHNLTGILPWKLIISDDIEIHRDENWINIIKEPIENAIKLLDEILKSEDKKKKHEQLFDWTSNAEFGKVDFNDYKDLLE